MNFIVSLLLISLGVVTSSPVPSTLQLVQVAFRHGQRTPASQTTYPTDPYNGWTYPPFGIGELTNAGKLGEYNIGRILRQRYAGFIPDTYSPNILEANTSDMNRTKASVQLALAGLFPPVLIEQWNAAIPFWSPIPFNVNPIISTTLGGCPGYGAAYEEALSAPDVVQFDNDNRDVYDYVSENSGLNISTSLDILEFRDIIYSQSAIGLPIPEWTNEVYPDKLDAITGFAWYVIGSTPDLLRYSAGSLVKYILDTANSSIYNEVVPEGRKIFIYSGHDSTLSWLLNTFEIFNGLWIPYSSFLLFELHNIQGEYYIRFLYQDYRQPEPKVVSPPGYDEYVPIAAVYQIASRVIDGDLSC